MKTKTGMTKYLRDGFLPIPPWVVGVVDQGQRVTEQSRRLCEIMMRQEQEARGRVDSGLSIPQTIGALTSMMQRFRECRDRIAVVDEADLLMAEQTSAIETIKGEEFSIPFPSFLLWFPRAIDGVTSHLIMVQAVDNTAEGVAQMQYRTLDREEPTTVGFHDGQSLDNTFRLEGCGQSLAITVFHTCRPKKHNPLIHFTEEETETSVLPLYQGASLLDCWTALCNPETGRRVRDIYLGKREAQTVDDQLNFTALKALNVVAHIVSMMSWYPEFVSTTRVARSRRSETNPKKKKIESISVMRVRQVVEVDTLVDEPTGKGGASKSQHWRRGHWRRQRHGPGWELANPDAPVITMSDGGRAHMVRISPLLIGAKEGAASK